MTWGCLRIVSLFADWPQRWTSLEPPSPAFILRNIVSQYPWVRGWQVQPAPAFVVRQVGRQHTGVAWHIVVAQAQVL